MFDAFALYNIGNSHLVELIDYIEAMERAFGKKSKKEYLDTQSGDLIKTDSDRQSTLENDFKYKPEMTLQGGINIFAQWYKNWRK